MSKVLVERELLERASRIINWLECKDQLRDDDAEALPSVADGLRQAIAQPAEAEWGGLRLAAEVAEEDGPWEPRLGMTNVETAFAQSASPTKVLELIAALSAVTAEVEGLRKERDRFRAEVNSLLDAIEAMAAKEA